MLTGRELIADINACEVKNGRVAIWWLGQHGFVLKLGKDVLYVDAFLTPMKGRTVEPLLKPEEVTNATAILGTHDHIDHIDRPSWPGMAKASPGAMLVTPKWVRDGVVKDLGLAEERVIGLDEGITTRVGEITVTAIPSAHEFLDRDEKTGLHPYLGYVIQGNGVCLYHAGDTCIYEGMQAKLRQWKLDVAFLPINGRDARRYASNCIGNMTYQEAADLAGAIRPGMTIPTHFEMFRANSENPELFVDYLRVKYPHLTVTVPRHGERLLV